MRKDMVQFACRKCHAVWRLSWVWLDLVFNCPCGEDYKISDDALFGPIAQPYKEEK